MDKDINDDQQKNDGLEERYDSLVHNNDEQTKGNHETTLSGVDQPPDQSDTTAIPDVVQPLSSPEPAFNLNKYFLYTLVAGLIVSALISVVAVLIGEFNSTVTRALGTTVSMVMHTLVALFLISINNKETKHGGSFVINTMILITVASFITSVLTTWDVMGGQIVGDLYLIYFYTFCASLWSRLLLYVGNNILDKATHVTSNVAIGFTVFLYLLLIPSTVTHYPNTLPDFYYRTMAATAILLATTSVLTTVFHRIHVFKHPEIKSLPSAKSNWDIVLAIIVLTVGVPFIFAIMVSLMSHSTRNEYTSTGNSEQVTERRADNLPLNKSTDSSTSLDQSTKGKSEVTQDDIDDYNRTAGVDCTSIAKYSQYDRDISKGTVSSIDMQVGIVYIKYDTGNTLYGRWKNNTLPQVVDKNCTPIQLTDIKSGDLVSIYDGDTSDIYHDAQDIRVIQKLE